MIATLLLTLPLTLPQDNDLARWAPEIFAEPETVPIAITILSAVDGLPGIYQRAPNDVQLVVVYADAPTDRLDELHNVGPYGREEQGWPTIHTLSVPSRRPLAFIAYSPTQGLAERVLAPDAVVSLSAAAPEPLTLVLPAPREPASLRVHAVAEPGIWHRPACAICVRAPLSDLVLAEQPSDHGGEPVDFVLPAGHYVLTADSYIPDMCGNGQPIIRPCSGLREPLERAPGERRTMDRFLDVGASFALRVDVRNCDADVESDRGWALGWLDFVRSGNIEVGEHFWTAMATIERIDTPDTERTVRLGWNECKAAVDKHHFPLGHTVYTTNRYTPAAYRLTVFGPRIETQSHEFDLEWSDSSWPTNWWTPLHVLVEAAD